MTNNEIAKLAREYAEEIYPNLSNKIISLRTQEIKDAERLIRFLLRTHCIVSKEKVNEAEGEVLSCWVARNEDGKLYLHRLRPERGFDDDRNVGLWGNCIGYQMIVPKSLFPSLTWDSEPMEVEITIKPKKK